VIAAVLVAVALGALARLDGLFEEPEARRIDSLATELGMRTLLCVFAHPDDEIMVAGALEDATRRGVRVHVITATRGEKGTPDVPVSGPDELARVREAELREHGHVLGIADQIVLGLPDREVDRHEAQLTEEVLHEIRRIRPDTLMTFHPASGYTYHPDHRAVGSAAVAAVEQSGAEVRLVYALAPRGVMASLGGEPGLVVAENQPAPTWAMPIDAEVKLRGWRIHASQGGYVQRAWKAPPRFLYVFFDEEHYGVP
jgi:LmbE family N-acetylglucosaminyl deacetylase